MKLEVGKRYVLRNGIVSGPMKYISGINYPWSATANGIERQWCENGATFFAATSNFDVVAEYSEPDPSHDVQQPLRWVENCKPDKPGIWAWVVDEGMFEVEWIGGPSSIAECVSGTWCYLGPIPEILPPKKKVVERLWLEAMANGIEPQTVLYRMHWCVDDNAKAYPINWIRTDNTREREV